MLELKCPRCGNAILPAEIQPNYCTAKCRQCGEQFEFDDQGENIVFRNTSSSGRPLVETKVRNQQSILPTQLANMGTGNEPFVQMPQGFNCYSDQAGLVINWNRWLTNPVTTRIIVIFMLLVVDGLFFFVIYMMNMLYIKGQFEIELLFLPVLLGFCAIFLSYNFFARFMNSTEIRVTADCISVRNHPLRKPKYLVVPIDSIEQFFCVQTYAVSRSGLFLFFDFRVLLKRGKYLRLTLVPSMEAYDHALFLQQQLEQHLGLKHRLIPGEFQPLPYQQKDTR